MLRRILVGVVLLLALGAAGFWYAVLRPAQLANRDPAYFEDAIRAFETTQQLAPTGRISAPFMARLLQSRARIASGQ